RRHAGAFIEDGSLNDRVNVNGAGNCLTDADVTENGVVTLINGVTSFVESVLRVSGVGEVERQIVPRVTGVAVDLSVGRADVRATGNVRTVEDVQLTSEDLFDDNRLIREVLVDVAGGLDDVFGRVSIVGVADQAGLLAGAQFAEQE